MELFKVIRNKFDTTPYMKILTFFIYFKFISLNEK